MTPDTPAPDIPTRFADGLAVYGINENETTYLHREIFEDRVYIPDGGFRLGTRPVIFDIGANIGMFTLFAHKEWSDARIHAFEPVPQICDVLRRNTEDLPGVHVHQLGAGGGDYTTTISYYPGFTVMSGLDADPDRDAAAVRTYVLNKARDEHTPEEFELISEHVDALLANKFVPVQVDCEIAAMDTLVHRSGVDRIDLLKVDAEGQELAILEGVGESLWQQIENAVVEIDGNGKAVASRDLLERHGMRTSLVQPREYRDTEQYILYAWRAN